jgi:uncharacterized secreted protein with C-terminal beta-propeller domain
MHPLTQKIIVSLVLLVGISLFTHLQVRSLGVSEEDLVYTEGRILEVITVRSIKNRDFVFYIMENLPEKVAIRRDILSADHISRSFKPGTILKVGHTLEIARHKKINAYALSANGQRVYGLENYARNFRSESKNISWLIAFLTLVAAYLLGTAKRRLH